MSEGKRTKGPKTTTQSLHCREKPGKGQAKGGGGGGGRYVMVARLYQALPMGHGGSSSHTSRRKLRTRTVRLEINLCWATRPRMLEARYMSHACIGGIRFQRMKVSSFVSSNFERPRGDELSAHSDDATAHSDETNRRCIRRRHSCANVSSTSAVTYSYGSSSV